MKKSSSHLSFAVSCTLVTMVVANGSTQQVSLDPTVVAPEEFVTVFENDRVRAVRVKVVDGTRPPRHAHPDRLVVFVTGCTWMETAEDGSHVEDFFPAGAVSWQEAVVHESYPNQVRETCELIEVELKDSPAADRR